MNRFSSLCQYVVILLVSFEHVRCSGDNGWGIWENLNDAEKLWDVTIQCQRSGNLQKPPLVMKLKQLSCPRLHLDYEDAYIIYQVDNEGDSSFELVAVPGNNGSTFTGRDTKRKIAVSIDKLRLENMLMNVGNKGKKELKVRDIFSVSPYHFYKMIFDEYGQAQEVYNKYAGRIASGCSPRRAE